MSSGGRKGAGSSRRLRQGKKERSSPIKLRGGGRGLRSASSIKIERVTVGDGYFLTFSIQQFYFFLYKKSWYLTVTDCHHPLFDGKRSGAAALCGACAVPVETGIHIVYMIIYMFVYYSYNRKIPFCTPPLHGRKSKKSSPPQAPHSRCLRGRFFCSIAPALRT